MNPTIYARLMDRALEHPLQETRELIGSFFEPPRDAMLNEIEEQVRLAYTYGVRDGYAQAVIELAATNDGENEPVGRREQ
jgi:hypothetical protein